MKESNEEWIIMKQGAEAKIYQGKFMGRQAVLKERFVKGYRHPSLDLNLTKERIKSEVRALARCRSIGIKTPAVYFVDLEGRTIIMEDLAEAITVREHIQNVFKICSNNRVEITRRLRPLMRHFGKTLCRLHQHSIIHGDLTTSNAMLCTECGSLNFYLIDFGLSSISDSAESKAVDLYVLERAFLSSHPNSEILFAELLDAYQSSLSKGGESEVISRLDEVRLRGRKRSMVG